MSARVRVLMALGRLLRAPVYPESDVIALGRTIARLDARLNGYGEPVRRRHLRPVPPDGAA